MLTDKDPYGDPNAVHPDLSGPNTVENGDQHASAKDGIEVAFTQ